MQRVLGPAYQDVLRRWRQAGPRILLADINTRVDDIPSLHELLTG